MKFNAFGFETFEVDGHCFESINSSLRIKDKKKPTAIIANTVKGKGVIRMENNNSWHHAAITNQSTKKLRRNRVVEKNTKLARKLARMGQELYMDNQYWK